MKKLSLFFLLGAMLFTAGCENEKHAQEIEKPTFPDGKASVTIAGDNMVTTRSASGRVEFTGGYATGAGLYDGDADALVEAVPYDGYQLVSFVGGPVDGSSNQFSGASSYKFKIQRRDWKFKVTFKKKDVRFIAVASSGNIIFYDNGNATSKKVGVGEWNAIAYGNGKYVAVGYASRDNYTGSITTSKDGIAWTSPRQVAYGSRQWWNDVVFADGRFVAVGTSGYVTTSLDGENWTAPQKVASNNFEYVTYGNGRFVAYASFNSSGAIFTSIDGVNWNQSPKTFSGYYWNDIVFGNGKFIMVGNHFSIEGYSYIISSTDGENWEEPLKIDENLYLKSVTYGNGKYVIVGDVRSSSSSISYVMTSEDGNNWTTPLRINIYPFTEISFGNDQFIGLNEDMNSLISSPDAISWEIKEVQMNLQPDGMDYPSLNEIYVIQ